jgi:hypothetical protein|uniref:Uncharacterized protein n=1 Tax=Bionectria ochroleuca TaxID=29856 RepID=A0A8H7NDA1_BIOOC
MAAHIASYLPIQYLWYSHKPGRIASLSTTPTPSFTNHDKHPPVMRVSVRKRKEKGGPCGCWPRQWYFLKHSLAAQVPAGELQCSHTSKSAASPPIAQPQHRRRSLGLSSGDALHHHLAVQQTRTSPTSSTSISLATITLLPPPVEQADHQPSRHKIQS